MTGTSASGVQVATGDPGGLFQAAGWHTNLAEGLDTHASMIADTAASVAPSWEGEAAAFLSVAVEHRRRPLPGGLGPGPHRGGGPAPLRARAAALPARRDGGTKRRWPPSKPPASSSRSACRLRRWRGRQPRGACSAGPSSAGGAPAACPGRFPPRSAASATRPRFSAAPIPRSTIWPRGGKDAAHRRDRRRAPDRFPGPSPGRRPRQGPGTDSPSGGAGRRRGQPRRRPGQRRLTAACGARDRRFGSSGRRRRRRCRRRVRGFGWCRFCRRGHTPVRGGGRRGWRARLLGRLRAGQARR